MERITPWSTFVKAGTAAGVILILTAKKCSECFSAPVMAIKCILAGLVFIGIVAWKHQQYLNLEKIIFKVDRQPVLSAAKATEGVPYSAEGKIIPTFTIEAPISKEVCVYCHIIRERLEKSGKSSKWIVRENTMRYAPFYVEDKSGRLLVDMINMDHDFSKVMLQVMDTSMPNPRNSEVDAIVTVKQKEYKIVKKLAADERWRVSEYILKPGENVFVYGMTCMLGKEKCLREAQDYPLIISRKTKEKYVGEFLKGSSIWYASSGLMLMGWLLFLIGANYFEEGLLIPGIIAGAAVLVILLMLRSYNRLVLLKQRAASSWSEVHIWLKKRADLIPKLVDVVKTYSTHEAMVNELIAELRKDLMFYPLMEGQSKTLIAIVEAYPKLKADESFRSLMVTIEDTEESIAQSREFYNRSVLKYKNICEQFPTNIVAKLAGMKPMRFIDRLELG